MHSISFTPDDLTAGLPVIILFASAMAVMVADLFRPGGEKARMSPLVHILSSAGAALAGLAIWATWDKPAGVYFDGALRVEMFSRVLSMMIVLGTLLTTLAAAGLLKRMGAEEGEFHALVLAAAGAMVLLAESNSLIMVFLSLETFSIAAYVLTGFRRNDRRSVEGALKYLLLGGFASGFLLLGLGFIFGATGELRLDRMAGRIIAGETEGLLLAGAGLVIIGLGFKVGAFPFHSWIPDAYQGAPTIVTGFMSVAVKTAGFAALTRIALVFFQATPEEVRSALAWVLSAMAVATCIFGNVVAIVQSSPKRMLAYSGIAHTGYLLIGLVAALSMREGRYFEGRGSAIVFYLLPYTLMTFGAFAVLEFLGEEEDEKDAFRSLRGLSQRRPLVALAMLIFMISLAGIPPTAGFWAKLFLFREAVAAGRWDLALVGIITSIVAVYYYLRVVVAMYLQPAVSAGPVQSGGPTEAPDEATAWTSPAAIAACAAGIVLIGIVPDGFLAQSVMSIQKLLAQP